MPRTIYAKNLTASGVEIYDLSGLYIDPYDTVELSLFFSIDEIDQSEDLTNAIADNLIILNDGEQDLSLEESYELSTVPTVYDVPYTFLDLLDTPNTYSGTLPTDRFIAVQPTEDGVKFTPITFSDLNDVPTYSGHPGKALTVDEEGTGLEYVDPTFLWLTDTPTTYSGYEGQIPTVNSEGTGLEFTTLSGLGLGDLPCLQIRRTTDYTFTSSWVDIAFDTTDIENNTDAIEHDDTNTDRILIKEDGYYKIDYGMSIEYTNNAKFQGRIRKNDTTVISGSLMSVVDDNDTDECGTAFIANLSSGDFLTLQLGFTDGSPGAGTAKADVIITIFKLQGCKGDKGDPGQDGQDGAPGAGSTINVYKDDVLVSGSPFEALNFANFSMVEATSSGIVTISGSGVGEPSAGTTLAVVQARRSTSYTLTTGYVDITFDLTDEETDNSVIEHNDTNTERIDIKEDGTYLISYDFDIDASTTIWDTTFTEAQIKKNGAAALPGSWSRTTTYNDDSIDGSPLFHDHLSNSLIATMSNGDYITLQLKYSNDVADTAANGTLKVIKLNGIKGDQGLPGGGYIDVEKDGQSVSGSPFNVLDFAGFDIVEQTVSGTVTISGSIGGTTDHSVLDNLDYASSKHTGFASTAALVNVSGTLQSQIDAHTADVDKHREINDSGAGSTDLWSAEKILSEIATVSGGGGGTVSDLAAVQARRSTAYTLTTSYVDITFNITDEETDDTVIEHNDSNTERIDIKADGTYLILYDFGIDSTTLTQWEPCHANGQVEKNGSTVLDGSHSKTTVVYDDSLDGSPYIYNKLNNSFLATLSNGDYVTLQLKYESYDADTATNGTFKVIKLDGAKGADGIDGEDGEQGPAGSGSTINVYDDGILVTGSPFEALNITGATVSGSATVSGAVDVEISAGSSESTFGSEYDYAESEGESSTTSTSWQQKIRLSVTGITAGTYRIGWSYEWSLSNHEKSGSSFNVDIDEGVSEIHQVEMGVEKNAKYSDGSFYVSSGFGHEPLSSGSHTIDLNFKALSGCTNYVRKARLEIWRVS